MPLAPKTDKIYNYKDYLTWSEDERWELIEGVPYDMTPAPGTDHQRCSGIIFNKIFTFLQGGKCEIFSAPFDVRLIDSPSPTDEKIITVVQPDISVVCDKNKIDKRGCIGSPDLIVEILSPSTSYKDETEKLRLYEKHGVREYWIVNPEAQYIMIYRLDGMKYGKPEYLVREDTLVSSVLHGLKINLTEIWG